VVDALVSRVARVIDRETATTGDRLAVDADGPIENACVTSEQVIAKDRGSKRRKKAGRNVTASVDTKASLAVVLAVHTATEPTVGTASYTIAGAMINAEDTRVTTVPSTGNSNIVGVC
jgi:hypothetical protein